MIFKIKSLKNDTLKEIKIEKIQNFDTEKNYDSLIHLALRKELTAKRQGNASTKTKHEVKGSTKKPWKQKGTGRARAGSVKSPIWRGGGIVFGPKPKDYYLKMPKKMKHLAVYSLFNKLYNENRIQIIEDIQEDFTKLKAFTSMIYPLTLGSLKFKDLKNNKLRHRLRYYKVLFIMNNEKNFKLVLKNIPWIHYIYYNQFNVNDLLNADEILMEESTLIHLNKIFNSWIIKK